MIRTLSLAAALAVLPLSAALAQQAPQPAPAAAASSAEADAEAAADSAAEAAIEAAASAFEARMEAFGERAEAISEDESLSEDQRNAQVAALWAEYQPEVAVFTAAISEHAGKIAQEALANIDVEALVTEALGSAEVQQAMAEGVAAGVNTGVGIAANSAWTDSDPEQLVTYQLMAQYGLDEAMDEMEADRDDDDAGTPASGD